MNKVFRSDKFPKMEVMLYDAPKNPHQIIAFSYLECIEDRRLNNPEEISDVEAREITEWVLNGGHTPSLEAIYLLFNIRGISKVLSHQLVRHRIGVSIDQRTQRANSKEYLGNFADGYHYVIPESMIDLLNTNPDIKIDFQKYMNEAQDLYETLLRLGVSEDEARYIIPQCSETSMNFKVIYKAFQGAASTRLCTLMQGEMVECFRLMHLALTDYDELLADYIRPVCLHSGRCNRNENNPTDDNPKGVCHYTIDGTIPVRKKDNTFNLTKYSKDATK